MTFLEGILADVDLMGTPTKSRDGAPGQKTPTTAGGRSTAKKRAIEELDMDDQDDVDAIETPTKKQKTTGLTPSTTPATAKTKKINGFLGKIQASTGKGKGTSKQPETPDYVLPSIRAICKTFKSTKLVPHIYTGVVICTGLGGLESNTESQTPPAETEESLKTRQLCLILAVFAITLTRMHSGDITQETFDTLAERGLTFFELTNTEGTLKREVEEWISKITAWATDDPSVTSWIDSIPLDSLPAFKLPPLPATDSSKPTKDTPRSNKIDKTSTKNHHPPPRSSNRPSRREEIARELEKEDPDDVLLPGLGTMFHDGLDYFSAEKMAEYQEWKADILRRAEALEKGQGNGKGRTAAVAR